MPKNIFEQLGDALTGADKRAQEEAAKKAADAKATEIARAQDEQDQAEMRAAGAAQEEKRARADAEAKAAELQRQLDEAKAAELQRQADEASFRQQLADVERAKAEAERVKAEAEAARVAAAKRTYVVQPGDSLSAIAASVYGDGGKWPQIFEANRDKIDNPNLIYPGQQLTIP